MLLPLASEPFTAPADRDMLPSERRAFVRTHRTCVFGYRRVHEGPAMSVVYYIPTDDDELLVSTMAGRGKARGVLRDGKVSLCVLDERWPFAYLQVYADAIVERDLDLVVDVMMAVGGRMSGQRLDDEARPFVEAMAGQENRIVIRCRPLRHVRAAPAAPAQQRPGRRGHPLGVRHHPVERTRPSARVMTIRPAWSAERRSQRRPAEAQEHARARSFRSSG